MIGKSREEWGITDLACMGDTITIVPCFESLGPDAIAYVLNQTEVITVFVEKKSLETLTRLKKDGKIPHLKNLVSFDPVDEAVEKDLSQIGVKTWKFQDIIEIGRKNPQVVL